MKNEIKLSEVSSLALSPTGESIEQDMKDEGYEIFINKKEYAKLTKKSIRSIDNYISQGYGCADYIKDEESGNNAPILFYRRVVAKYLSEQTKKMG